MVFLDNGKEKFIMNNVVPVSNDISTAIANAPIAPVISENDILKFFNLDRENIQNFSITHAKDGIAIHVRLNSKPHICPVCLQKSQKVKDYVPKRITHSILNGQKCYILYDARRYQCPHCRKIFYENNPFSIGGQRVSVTTVYNILKDLKEPTETFTSVAKRHNVSKTTAVNIFDKNIHVSRRPLPECLGIDEVYAFKSDHSQYVCVLVDCATQQVVDILPSRKKDYLVKYFELIPEEERRNVKYCSFDMWQTYRVVSKQVFPEVTCMLDRFHVVQELNRCVNRVRIDTQNKYYSTIKKLKKKDESELTHDERLELDNAQKHYYVLKKFNWLLTSNAGDAKIADPNIEKKYNKTLKGYYNYYDLYDYMIADDPDLDIAYCLKYDMNEFYRKCTYKNAAQKLDELIIEFRTCQIESMSKFANTLVRWKPEIINSFIIIKSTGKRMNTAIVENRNKTIKLIKHSSNGYQNWERFRNRVLLCLNSDELININFTEGRRY